MFYSKAMISTTVVIPDASTTMEATTVLHHSLIITLLHKPATFSHHKITTSLPDTKATYIPEKTTNLLPDTTTLPDVTSRMLHKTVSSTHEPMTSTYNPREETTIGTSTPGATFGTCPQGFVPCTDGRCEPYDSLCGQFTPKPPPTTTFSVASNTKVTSPMEWTLSSTNTDETTTFTPPFTSSTYSGPETCPNGFETCSDGKCEPFHFLCEEHQLGIPAISIVG
ncbi:hypothetical protein ACJMK2_024798 [Sinanodonta woodiana]|uniref:Chitin-binding type-1 domain-containing protein n=1 Tax=Sinanodonta woodiana TaxID=1069815 RepID=A0ABD3XGH3_SINWO